MEIVGITSNQSGTGNCSLLTGHTVNYGDTSIHYVRVSLFSKIHNISEKQLQRYRSQIVSEKLDKEHRLYFHLTDGIYYYNEKILEKRKYGIGKSIKEVKQINHCVQRFTGSLLNRIKKQTWGFACGVNYKRRLQIEDCVQRMNQVNKELNEKFPDVGITMFFTTEPNQDQEGFHNHLVLSIQSVKKPSLNQIKKVLSHAGTFVPWVDNYDPTDNYIDYMVKHIYEHPDGWGIFTNSESDFKALYSNLSNEPLYEPQNRKEWPEKAIKWL